MKNKINVVSNISKVVVFVRIHCYRRKRHYRLNKFHSTKNQNPCSLFIRTCKFGFGKKKSRPRLTEY